MLGKALQSAGKAVEAVYVEDVFSTYLYDGNGSTQTITNGIDLSGKGGMVWIKGRSGTTGHRFTDTARGATKSLDSSSTAAEATESTGLTAFNANGFTIGANANYNTSGDIYVGWTFRKQAKFFDVVTYTGDGVTTGRAISHNLGSTPGCVIVKRTGSAGGWKVWHRSTTSSGLLNSTAAFSTADSASTDPRYKGYISAADSTTFTVSQGTGTFPVQEVNSSSATYVAYLFAHDAGGFGASGSDNVISCGSYTTDASARATIDLGYEPQWVLVKRSSGADNWFLMDTMRGFAYSDTALGLMANTSTAESLSASGANLLYPLATGFRDNGCFAVSSTFIYIAIRRGPMKTPTDATKVFTPTVYTGTNVDNRLVNTTIAPDMAWFRMRTGSGTGYEGFVVGDRLRGQPWLKTGTTQAEQTVADGLDQQLVSAVEYGNAFSSMSGVWVGNNTGTLATSTNINANTTSNNHVVEAFKRAPGFFDIVCYTGTGANRTLSHNLGVAPELMIVKGRSIADAWAVYSQAIGNTKYLHLNENIAAGTSATYWNNTSPTSSSFTVGTGNPVNQNTATFVAYLFATCPGVSKVGSYTGNGTSQTIDCGFTSGARFVLIKQHDAAGSSWVLMDSARGITTGGNEPILYPNLTSAELTTADVLDASTTGFFLRSSTANVNGAQYIFLAIA